MLALAIHFQFPLWEEDFFSVVDFFLEEEVFCFGCNED